MEPKDLQRIYDKTLENSVGIEKKCPFKKTFKNVVIKVATVTLLLTFMASSLTGCMGNIKNLNPTEETQITSSDSQNQNDDIKINGFEPYYIFNFERARVFELLEAYNLTEFEFVSAKRDYKYTSEDYKKIIELDESYLYGFYVTTTRETLNEVCKSLGYENIEDFLNTKGYVDKNGKPSVSAWYDHNIQEITSIMEEAQQDMEGGRK